MKGELEDSVKALGFKHVVIIRPGLIVGDRKDSRPAEFAMRKVAAFMGAVSGNRLKDFWAQGMSFGGIFRHGEGSFADDDCVVSDDDVIAKAAVNAGLKCINGEVKEAVWEIGQADIVRLGRTEWKH